MEKKRTLEGSNNPPENSPGKRDRFMELMEVRHRNAIAALQVERLLSQEGPLDEYPTTSTPENIKAKQDAFIAIGPILDSLSAAGYTQKKEIVKLAIHRYLQEKVRAQRVELELREKIKNEGKESTAEEFGTKLFNLRTGKSPAGPIEAIRQEGYFVIVFFSDKDYFEFISDFSNKEESGGFFHRAMRFPEMSVDVVLSRNGWSNRILRHERQHFINQSILQDFVGIERDQVPPKKEFPRLAKGVNAGEMSQIVWGLREVKDELLARIRDGSDAKTCTDFLGEKLYEYLQEPFSPDELEEANRLLKKVEKELKVAHLIFTYPPKALAVLIYHLADVPILRFPERIKAVAKFYAAKHEELLRFVPEHIPEKIDNPEKKKHLADLKKNIEGEAYAAFDLVIGVRSGSYEEQTEELRRVKDKIAKLRTDYDSLLRK